LWLFEHTGVVAVNLNEIVDGLSSVSLRTLALAVQQPSRLHTYVAYCLKRYDELADKGLPSRSPVIPASGDTISLPAVHTGGGMSFSELVILARVTKTRRPRAIFEMGSYDGLATAVFLLNAPDDAQVYSLDLPPQSGAEDDELSTDKELVAARHIGAIPKAIGLNHYSQILCDSMQFDPAPFRNSIALGLVDAAHDVKHVSNDTAKMAQMLTDDAIVFWHDYGGKGSLRPLANYLESLARKCSLFRIPETSLAWGYGKDLKQAFS
jgi:methyltransferase family protein